MGGANLMITITDRSRGGEFAAWFQSQGVPLVLTVLGQGTATTEILDCLGLEATEKTVLLCVTPHSPRLVRRAAKELWLDVPGRGILMTVPVSTIGGAAAVVSVKDGEILSLATYPSYSQRTYQEDYGTLSQDPAAPYTNRAVNGAYTPGSTFKPMTAAAALESGIIDPKTKINATGHWTYPGDPNSYANCWLYNSSGGRHGKINVSEALTVSCNYFFAEMGYQLGMERLNEYAAAFGLGEHTGIEISERTGARHENTPGEDQSPWAGFGQAQQVYTPLQLANYIATLLRGGQRLDAHLLRDVTSYDGGAVLYTHQPEILADLSLSEETLMAVKKGMGDLVTTGSLAGEFKNCTVTAGAKTGSAQVGDVVPDGVFVCFAPFEDPEIAVAVVIEQGRSGAALAPIAVQILNDYFTPGDTGYTVVPEGTLLP